MKSNLVDSVTLRSDSTEQSPPLIFVDEIKSPIVVFNIILLTGLFNCFCSPEQIPA